MDSRWCIKCERSWLGTPMHLDSEIAEWAAARARRAGGEEEDQMITLYPSWPIIWTDTPKCSTYGCMGWANITSSLGWRLCSTCWARWVAGGGK